MGFGHQDRLGSGRNPRCHGNKPGITPHHFDKKQPIVGASSVANFIDRFHRRIDCSVVTNGIIRAHQVIVDGTRATHKLDVGIFLHKNMGPSEGAVPANGNDAIDAKFGQVFVGFAATFGRAEFGTTRRTQDCSTLLDDVADRMVVHVVNVAVNKTLIPTADTCGTQAFV